MRKSEATGSTDVEAFESRKHDGRQVRVTDGFSEMSGHFDGFASFGEAKGMFCRPLAALRVISAITESSEQFRQERAL